jgi:hypothetical protein
LHRGTAGEHAATWKQNDEYFSGTQQNRRTVEDLHRIGWWASSFNA